MTLELLWAVVAAAVVLVAFALLIVAVSIARLARDARTLTARTERLLAELEPEVPPALRHLRGASGSLEMLTREIEPRLRRADALMQKTEMTLLTLRSTLEAVEGTVRAPVDAVEGAVKGARRTVRSVQRGLAHGADRLRERLVAADDGDPGA